MKPTHPTLRQPTKHLGRSLAFAVGVAAAWLLGTPAGADVVRLKTGETVKGQPIQQQSTDEILVMEDVLTGAVRQLRWEVVAPEDRDRIKQDWGLENKAASLAKGVRLVQILEGGLTEEIYGVIEKRDDAGITLRSDGQLHRIPKAQILGEPEPVELDPRTVWTAKELWDIFLAELRKEGKDDVNPDAPTPVLHFRMAQYAEWIDYLEKAKVHYEAAAGDAEFARTQVAQERLVRVETLLRAAAARGTLLEVKKQLSSNLFKKARAILDGFAEKHPDAAPEVTKEYEKLKAKATEQRTRFFQQFAQREFDDVVEDLIRPKVKEKNEKNEEITIAEIQSWTRKELPDKAFEALAEKMKSRDDVTPDEARTFWDGRPKRGWIRKSYGDGSFVVNPPKLKPPKPKKANNPPKNASKGPQVKFEIPKPPTRDQWWEKAEVRERVNWVFAFFGENSELFEVGAREFRPCILCQGTGLESHTDQTGQVTSWLCRRCAGSQQDITAKFR